MPDRAVLTMGAHQTSQIIAIAIIVTLSLLFQAITPGGKRAPNYLVPLNPLGIYGSLNVRVSMHSSPTSIFLSLKAMTTPNAHIYSDLRWLRSCRDLYA